MDYRELVEDFKIKRGQVVLYPVGSIWSSHTATGRYGKVDIGNKIPIS